MGDMNCSGLTARFGPSTRERYDDAEVSWQHSDGMRRKPDS